MTARWWQLADPDRLDETAQGHDTVAAEYEAKASWFRRKAADFRAEAQEIRDSRDPGRGAA